MATAEGAKEVLLAGLWAVKLELGHPSMGTVFVLLAGATAYAASALENTVAQDGDRPLGIEL